MDCAAILELLSEYVDGTLDVQTRKAVEKHIAVCENCKQELASLRAVVEELGALEPVKPPEDFLEKIHEHMTPHSALNKIFRKLFVPFHIKIPLELAAAATVTFLVVLVLNIQQPEIQMMKMPIGTTSQSMGENPKTDHIKPALKSPAEPPATILEEAPAKQSDSGSAMLTRRSRIKTATPLTQRESKPSSSFMAKAESKHAAGKGHPIELALVIKTGVIGGAFKPGIAMQAAPLLESQESTVEKESAHTDSFKRKIDAREKDRGADLLTLIKHIIDRAQGKILIVKYNGQAEQLQSIDAEIPAQSYESFCTQLTGLATFQNPPPDLADIDLETIQVRLRFLSD
jgi:hypothetical protein